MFIVMSKRGLRSMNMAKEPDTIEKEEAEVETKESYKKPVVSKCTYIGVGTGGTILIISVCIALAAVQLYELRRIHQQLLHDIETTLSDPVEDEPGLTYWVYGRNVNSGYLKHVFLVLERLGYKQGSNESNWDLLWSHSYPFRELYSQLYDIQPHQKVNHIPGCGFITNKVELSTSQIKNVPVAFRLPQDKDKWVEYSRQHPNKLFVQKSNAHRGIKIENATSMDLNLSNTFIQEYVEKPFLVDGYKFDVGVYTIITSVEPLRVYVYYGDVLFRYCPVKYYPFDPLVLDKYVVGDDYLPTWEVPSLKKLYTTFGYSMKDSFDAYVRSQGKDPAIVWQRIDETIREICLKKEKMMVAALKRFKSTVHNFFEMVRFDFVLDEDLNVYVMEANMSPNLSSAHYPPNQLLYEQVIFNMMGLVGVANRVKKSSLKSRSAAEDNMQAADKNLVVNSNFCSSGACQASCENPDCDLCLPCLNSNQKLILKKAYLEYFNRGDCHRIFPPDMKSDQLAASEISELSQENKWMYRWFHGKCQVDRDWC